MNAITVHDFGILPQGVVIWNGGPTTMNIEVPVRFAVELWRVGEVYELRHSHQKFKFSGENEQQIILIWQSPAKGPGNSSVAVGDVNAALFYGGYENLQWMRATALKLAELLQLDFREDNRGRDC